MDHTNNYWHVNRNFSRFFGESRKCMHLMHQKYVNLIYYKEKCIVVKMYSYR